MNTQFFKLVFHHGCDNKNNFKKIEETLPFVYPVIIELYGNVLCLKISWIGSRLVLVIMMNRRVLTITVAETRKSRKDKIFFFLDFDFVLMQVVNQFRRVVTDQNYYDPNRQTRRRIYLGSNWIMAVGSILHCQSR